LKYDYKLNDMATFYFIIGTDEVVHGWTDDKKKAQLYLEFHNCPYFKMRKVEMLYKDILRVLNEYIHHQINIEPMITRDEDGEIISVGIPTTHAEMDLFNDYESTSGSLSVDYALIQKYFDMFKPKYQAALRALKLDLFIDKELYNKTDPWFLKAKIDQVRLFVQIFSDYFDKGGK